MVIAMSTNLNEGRPVPVEEIVLEPKFDLAPIEKDRAIVVRRPTKFTEQAKRKILIALQMGHFPGNAASYGGITKSTLLSWWDRGQLAGLEAEGVDLELYEFSEACVQATANGKIGLIAILWRHARDDGKVAIALLEKLYPREYGRQTVHSGTVKVEHEMKKPDYSSFTNEELAEMERLAIKARNAKAKEEAIDAEIV